MSAAKQQAAAARVVSHLDRWPDIGEPADRWLIRCLVGTGDRDDVELLRAADADAKAAA